jgi:hypothetical protein
VPPSDRLCHRLIVRWAVVLVLDSDDGQRASRRGARQDQLGATRTTASRRDKATSSQTFANRWRRVVWDLGGNEHGALRCGVAASFRSGRH